MEDSSTIIFFTLLVSAFFSAIEIAFLASNKLRIELLNQKGNLSAYLSILFIKNPSKFLTTTQICNNVSLVIYGFYSSQVIEQYLVYNNIFSQDNQSIIFIVKTLISSLFVLFVAEFIPKAISRVNPNMLFMVLSYPFTVFYYAFYPFVLIMDKLSIWVVRFLFNTKIETVLQNYTRYDLMHFVTENNDYEGNESQNDSDVDAEIFKNAIEFQSIEARDCMTHRTDIIGIEVNSSIEELQQKFIETELSKILVFRNNTDNIIGYIHLVDLYKNPKQINKIVKPVYYASETTPAKDLLKSMLERRRSIAVVLDEFGGTSGIVTIEDILEEIIGEINDEHDVDDLLEKQTNDKEFEFSARLEIDYINEKYGLRLPEGDYETLNGFILHFHQEIPKEGEKIYIEDFEITILNKEANKVNTLHIKTK